MSERKPTEEEIDEYFAAENADSLMQVPEEQLPEDILHFLVRCALSGRDVFAYKRPVVDEYNVWYDNRRYEAAELTKLWIAGKLFKSSEEENSDE